MDDMDLMGKDFDGRTENGNAVRSAIKDKKVLEQINKVGLDAAYKAMKKFDKEIHAVRKKIVLSVIAIAEKNGETNERAGAYVDGWIHNAILRIAEGNITKPERL